MRPAGSRFPPSSGLAAARAALAGLTIRGRSLIAAGIACICSAIALGEEDLIRIGVLLLVLPLAATAVLARVRLELTCLRTLDPGRVPVDGLVRVTVQVQNSSRLTTGLLFAEDTVPPELGTTPRFALDRVASGAERTASYPLRPLVRGHHEVGPLTVRLCDPFGFCELERAFSAVDRLTVTPSVVPLPGTPTGGTWSTGERGRGVGVGQHGEDDLGTRPYRVGDELRRVHWRTTARVGELSVRREEQPRLGYATVLLDTRAEAFRTEHPAAHPAVEPGRSAVRGFETAVSITASVAVTLGSQGSAVRLLMSDGTEFASPATDMVRPTDSPVLLDALATVTSSASTGATGSLARVIAQLAARPGGLVVAVLGRVTPPDVELLGRLSMRSRTVAILVGDGAHSGQGARLLTEAGWRVAVVPDLEVLPAAWQRLLASRVSGATGGWG